MKELLLKILPSKLIQFLIHVKGNYFGGYSTMSYSQEGEDLILNRLFEKQRKGFYVDVGAHHPKRFSNTYLFYKKGWSGINIDAKPGSMRQFNKIRKKDINLEIPISNNGKILTYYAFNEPALNTFSADLASKRIENNDTYFIQEKIELQTYKLSEVLDKYLPEGSKIDFLTIDVEGLDYNVIQSNDWNKYSPRFILVELLNTHTLIEIIDDEITKFLNCKGYTVFAKSINTVFYKKINFER